MSEQRVLFRSRRAAFSFLVAFVVFTCAGMVAPLALIASPQTLGAGIPLIIAAIAVGYLGQIVARVSKSLVDRFAIGLRLFGRSSFKEAASVAGLSGAFVWWVSRALLVGVVVAWISAGVIHTVS